MPNVHPTAIVDPRVKLAEGVSIGPYAIVEVGTRIGEGCRVAAHAVVREGSELGENVWVDSFAVIGGVPQDFKFDPACKSGVRIGAGTQVREHVTIHRGSREGSFTEIGERVMLMGGAHVGHDVCVGAHCIIANNVLLAGEVSVGAHSFLSGGVVVHQFSRIGESAMLSGNATVSREVPPFVTVANRNTVYGLNLVGLKRRGFDAATLVELKRLYRAIYLQAGNPAAHARKLAATDGAKTEAGRTFLAFFAQTGKRAYVLSRRQGGGRDA